MSDETEATGPEILLKEDISRRCKELGAKYIGFCGQALEVGGEKDRVVITLNVEGVQVADQTATECGFVLGVSMFKELFRKGFSPHLLSEADFYVMVDLPKALLKPLNATYVDAMEERGGYMFAVGATNVDKKPTTLLPRLVDASKGSNDSNEEE